MHLRPVRILLWTTLIAAPALAGEPPLLEDIDPLARPAPHLRPLAIPPDDRAASDKIVSALRTEAALRDPEERIRIIVTLHDPNLYALSAGEGLNALEERDNIAAVEHRFVHRGEPLGFAADRGLAHFPIVIGEVDVGELGRLAALPEVRGVEKEREYREHRIQGRQLMDADRLRTNFGGTGAGVGVAVLDSGIDWTHPELDNGRVAAQADFTGTRDDGFDDRGHGTSVAGIIAGDQRGVAPRAWVWAMKVLDAAGDGTNANILAALDSVFHHRHEFGGIHAVNMSLGGGGPVNSDCDASSPSFRSVFNRLVGAGIAIFVASGNEAFRTGVAHPACHSTVIAVGAVYDADVGRRSFNVCTDPVTGADRVTCYSNSGDPLDILAPSDCARTPALGGGYTPCFNGTSAASPYAAGVAAQILSLRPNTSPAQLRTALMSTGRPITDRRNGLVRNRVRAVAAYESLASLGPCIPSSTTLCIDDRPGDRRFKVELEYQTSLGGGLSGRAQALPLSSLGVNRGGLFWFAGPDNPEMVIKVLRGCSFNNHFWVFYAATTNFGLTTRVTDTVSGRVWTRTNPDLRAAAPVQDTSAFPCN